MGPKKQGHRWGSCYLTVATISTLQSSDVQGVLLVPPNPEFWPEGSTGLSASFSVSNSLSYIPPLHLSSVQFSLLDLPKILYLLAHGTECTFSLSGSLSEAWRMFGCSPWLSGPQVWLSSDISALAPHPAPHYCNTGCCRGFQVPHKCHSVT